jgi:TPR repeat protein
MARRIDEAEAIYRRGVRAADRGDDKLALAYFVAASRMGHADAGWRAGKALVCGWGEDENPKRGFELLQQAVARGSGEAHWQLAYFHQNGFGTRKDPRRALAYAIRGWTTTRAACCAAIAGDIYSEDLGEPRLAFKWYLRGAKGGDIDAMTTTGIHYRYGTGVAQDMKEAVRWYRRAARLDCPHANNNLGICYKNGEGVRRSPRRAFEYRRRAAELGHSLSKVVVADWTIDGFGVRRDVARGMAELLRLARSDPEAAWAIGNRLLDGDGVPKQPRRGFRWLMRAAEKGHCGALFDVGVRLHNGDGVRRDFEASVEYYRRAAELGSGRAWRNLGLCYRDGEGVAKDAAKARECFAKARENECPCDDEGGTPTSSA